MVSQSSGSEHLEVILRKVVTGVRLRGMLDTFLKHYRDTAGKETVELALSCCTEASDWYWKMLTAQIIEEKNRRDTRSISAVLEKDLFHRCLVACSLEIAVFSKSFPCDVPMLLKIIGLHPYHFWKVIELVLRAVMGLPQPMFKHLAEVETQILETLVWTTSSPLWEELEANGGYLPPWQQVMRSSQPEEPKKSNVHPDINVVFADHNYSVRQYLPSATNRPPTNKAPQLFARKVNLLSQMEEPKNEVHPAVNIALVDHNYSVQQYSSSAINRLPRSKSLQLFARKVYRLMADRLHKLCRMLEISNKLRLKIWTCCVHSLVHCTDLMADRHLDQLLLCAIKIITELYNRVISFEDVIRCYCSQPMAEKNVCSSVLLSRKDGETQNLKGSLQPPLSCLRDIKPIKMRHFPHRFDKSIGHGSNVLTPSTPSSPQSGKELRGSLSQFYIRVYASKMEAFAKKFEAVPRVDTPPLTPYPQRRILRKQRLRGTCNIYISPYNAYTPPPLSPAVSYTVNLSTRECLKDINKLLKRYTRPEEESEDGPSVKVPCLVTRHIFKLESGVENDRLSTH